MENTTETKRINLTKCRNKLCALYNPNKVLNCAASDLGVEDKYDIRSCNLRDLYQELVKRQVHDEWLEKNRTDWNLFQKAYRNKNKNKNETNNQ